MPCRALQHCRLCCCLLVLWRLKIKSSLCCCVVAVWFFWYRMPAKKWNHIDQTFKCVSVTPTASGPFWQKTGFCLRLTLVHAWLNAPPEWQKKSASWQKLHLLWMKSAPVFLPSLFCSFKSVSLLLVMKLSVNCWNGFCMDAIEVAKMDGPQWCLCPPLAWAGPADSEAGISLFSALSFLALLFCFCTH